MVLARFYFGIPFQGSHILFLIGTFLFISSYMALGLLVSVATRQQILAMQFSMMIGMLPNMLLSGFIFPIENMPPFFQYLTAFFPARWFVLVIRGGFPLRVRTCSNWQGVPLLAMLLMSALFRGAGGEKGSQEGRGTMRKAKLRRFRGENVGGVL